MILKCGYTLKPTRKLLENTDIQTPSHTKLKQDIWEQDISTFLKASPTIEKIDKTQKWFFRKINKIGKPLAILTKRKETRLKIRSKKIGYITTYFTET